MAANVAAVPAKLAVAQARASGNAAELALAMKRLKAYQVSDGADVTVIRFATSSAAARREGGNEIGCEWDGVDSCARKPEYDQYAPGPVPARALIEAGWQFECRRHGCGNCWPA